MTTQRRDGNATPLERWIRGNPKLDSYSEGLSVTDSDWWIHQYKTHTDKIGTRVIQNLMLVELKICGSDLTFAQKDTLRVIDVALKQKHDIKLPMVNGVGSRIVRMWGVHILRLEGHCPISSKWILWNGKLIDIPTLEDILTFKRNPGTLSFRSERRHHKNPYKSFKFK